MSYSYQVTERRRRTANGGGYGASGNRSTFGYWVPLVLTVTAATIGLVAWVWSERGEDEEESSADERYPAGIPPPKYTNMSGGLPPGPGPSGFQGSQGQMPGPPMQGGFQGPPQQSGSFQGPPLQPGEFQGQQGPMPGPPAQGGFQGPPQQVGGYQGPPSTGGFREVRESSTARSTGVETQAEPGFVARVSGVFGMGRAASPADLSKKVVAGVTAAGAMVGGALSSIGGGGGQDGYEDHERWSEEAEQRDGDRDVKQGIKRRGTADEFFSGAVEVPKQSSMGKKKRRSVAIVVSAVPHAFDGGADLGDHASILAHLPEYIDPDTTRIFVLIYAPELRTHPLSPAATRRPSQSMTSSFSNISQTDAHTPAHTPGEFPGDSADGILTKLDPNPIDEASVLYKTLHNQAEAIVEKDSMILPFTSKNGHKHILKSLSPDIVYIQETLCGPEGEVVSDISGWVRQTVVVIGDEGGHGGLVDTDDESNTKSSNVWWQKEERTGLGKRVAVVESLKIGDDWRRRVNEHD